MESKIKDPRRFFIDNFDTKQKLDFKLIHRIFTVLRFKKNQELEFTDGLGNVFKSKVIKTDLNKNSKLENQEFNFFDYFELLKKYKELKNLYDITLAVSIFRPEYFKFMVQKAVELGANKIIPLISEYTKKYNQNFYNNFKNKNQEIADQALSQCKRAYRLNICDVIDISKLDTKKYNNVMVFHPDGKNLNPIVLKEKKMLLIFGPEGGFSNKDLSVLKNYPKYKLTEHLLRSETAVIYVLSSIDSMSKLNLN